MCQPTCGWYSGVTGEGKEVRYTLPIGGEVV